MGLILIIETATEVCSVALVSDGKLLSIRESDRLNSHSAKLAVYIDEVIKEAGISVKDIEAVAVSKGPGSYTGLRIGVSSAKGLCYALNIPLISVDTLQSMCFEVIKSNIQFDSDAILCPMIDARRMEVYSAFYDVKLNTIRPVQADIVDEDIYQNYLSEHKVYFFGNGALKCKNILGENKNAVFDDNIKLSAKGMHAIAERKFLEKDFENTAYFEPFYLKDFVAAKPVVKGLH